MTDGGQAIVGFEIVKTRALHILAAMTPSADENNARAWSPILSWFVPNLSVWLWLILFLFLIADPQRTKLVSSDSDANMHWRVGESMLETKQIVRSDAFSHTRFGAPVVSKEWLSQILFAIAGHMRGLTGLSILGAIVIATTFSMLHRQLVRDGTDLLTATLVVLIAAWASVPHWHARPHVFSFLMLLLWHRVILRFLRNDGNGMKLALTLGLLMLLWVNLHGGYLAGFIVLGGYWVAALVGCKTAEGRRKLTTLTWVGLLCAAVSLLNPNGWRIHVHNLQFVQSPFFVNWLDEYSSINFHAPDSFGVLAWLVVFFLVIVLCRPRFSLGAWIVLISWSYFALYAVRNVTFFAILSAPILAPVLSDALCSDAIRWWRNVSTRLARVDGANCGWLTAIAIALVVACYVPVKSMPARTWPVAAVEYIERHPEQFKGNMFNLYGWGGYLLRVAPDHKVFVDGRADFYGEALVRDYDEIQELHPRWFDLMERYDVSWTLLPVNHRLNQALPQLDGWHPVYTDDVAVVFCKMK